MLGKTTAGESRGAFHLAGRAEEPLEERRPSQGTRSQGSPRSQGTGESPRRDFLQEGGWFLLLHSDLTVTNTGVLTPRSTQAGSGGGCLLRAVLIKLSLVWFLVSALDRCIFSGYIARVSGGSAPRDSLLHHLPCFLSANLAPFSLLQTEILHLLFAGIYKDGGSAGAYVCRVPPHTIDTQQMVLDCML